ncbi:MAG: PAS-domain containing protein [Roseovarius sp.]
MAGSAVLSWIALALLALAASFAMLWVLGVILPKARPSPTAPEVLDEGCVYLFEDELLFDHSARILPGSANGAEAALEWLELKTWLEPRFNGLPARLDDLRDDTNLVVASCTNDGGEIILARSGRTTRITLSDPTHDHPDAQHDMLCARAELADLIDAFEAAPNPIWKTSCDGAILWQNTACARVFDTAFLKAHVRVPPAGETTATRIAVPHEGSTHQTWYDIQSTARAQVVLHHATDVTKVVRAETVQKDFVQTLTKTFAYLTIGLAVFDRKRQLALFNPALIDLTALPVDFLSGQPDLMSFFDNLRNRNVMPEPRSYASWRAQINQVIDAAEGGLYQETWTMPNDVTYRVTGRPHPDGAVAFLFEDISAEVMLAQRYRAQLDLRQSALDTLPEAVMVIGPNNVLSFCNSAATDLLGIDPDSSFADMSVTDLLSVCGARFDAPKLWASVETGLRQRTHETPLFQSTEIAPGHSIDARIEVLPGGARMLILLNQKLVQNPAQARAPAA